MLADSNCIQNTNILHAESRPTGAMHIQLKKSPNDATNEPLSFQMFLLNERSTRLNITNALQVFTSV